ncbi:hypothetical protein Slin15195_G094790 [Septoria linicola]|uniref:Uncharacterized protein n=1 Tax=Septoria linicola TaxID=215465 RepID=A0A9Q9EML2_9PEZI|nr:hypothetical protein Slin15195_G094790 [Septoria linicola]
MGFTRKELNDMDDFGLSETGVRQKKSRVTVEDVRDEVKRLRML